MSNEELAIQIQAGNRDLMPELWEQVRRFVAMKARHTMTALEGRGDVELDDLIQSGYLALESAASNYDPEGGYAFLTCLGYHLKTAFAEATRFRSERQKRETLAGALSLDAPVNDEENASTLMHFQEDLSGAEALEAVEDKIYQAQLRETMAAVLADLPEEQRELLRLRYWEDATLQEIATAQGITPERVRKKEYKAICELRRPRNACRLRPFIDFNFYSGSTLGTFRSTGASVQELYLLRKEQAAERQQAELDAELKRAEDAASQRIARMTPEEKDRLLEKYGYV